MCLSTIEERSDPARRGPSVPELRASFERLVQEHHPDRTGRWDTFLLVRRALAALDRAGTSAAAVLQRPCVASDAAVDSDVAAAAGAGAGADARAALGGPAAASAAAADSTGAARSLAAGCGMDSDRSGQRSDFQQKKQDVDDDINIPVGDEDGGSARRGSDRPRASTPRLAAGAPAAPGSLGAVRTAKRSLEHAALTGGAPWKAARMAGTAIEQLASIAIRASEARAQQPCAAAGPSGGAAPLPQRRICTYPATGGEEEEEDRGRGGAGAADDTDGKERKEPDLGSAAGSGSTATVKPPPVVVSLACTAADLDTGATKRIRLLDAAGRSRELIVRVKPGWSEGTRVTFKGPQRDLCFVISRI